MTTLAVILLSSSVAWSAPGRAMIRIPGADLVPVSSRPAGSAGSPGGMPLGKSPVVAPVPGNSDGIVTSEASGVETRKIDPDQEFHGTLALNLLWIVVWPLVPLAIGVDLIAGNAGKHSPKPLRLGLVPLRGPAPLVLLGNFSRSTRQS